MADKIHLHCAPKLGSGYDGITFAMSIEAVAKRLDIWPFARVPAARPQALGECTYRQYHLGKDGIFEDLAWRGEAVVMTFKNGGLRRILLGAGWQGEIFGLRIGGWIREQWGGMKICFDDAEDVLYLQDCNGEDIFGLEIWASGLPFTEDAVQQIRNLCLYGRERYFCQ